METIAILPVRAFESAKQRLAEGLPAASRSALAEAMFTDVVRALRHTPRIEGLLVVSDELRAQQIAAGDGVTAIDDPQRAGQSAAAALGIARALRIGAQRALLVPGDCPLLDPDELDALLAAPHAAPSVVIVPDRHGSGTNALLLSPPDAIEPSFGPGSRERHEQLAAAAGADCEVVELDSLALDVDTAEDLAALEAALAERHGRAAHTRGMLSQMQRSAR